MTSKARTWPEIPFKYFTKLFQWPLADLGTDTADNFGYSSAGNQPPFDNAANGPAGLRFRPFSHPSELNTNSSMSNSQRVIIRDNGAEDLTMLGYNNPAMSAWGLNVALPVFKKPLGFTDLTAYPSVIDVEFKLVKIINY